MYNHVWSFQVQKEKEQLAAIDKQKEKLMASKVAHVITTHCHRDHVLLSDLSSTEK